jgi:hypothetical protein
MLYVTMTDDFMSGWGRAEGRINKLVFKCDTAEEAYTVKKNAKGRNEMKYVNICIRKPYYPSRRYLAQYKTRETSPNWYKPGHFS